MLPFATRYTLIVLVGWVFALYITPSQAAEPMFKKHVLDPAFRSEGVCVADFNKDGKNDISVGYLWYEAPDWKMHSMVEKIPEYKPQGYSNVFCAFAEDVNADGWVDVLAVDFPGTPTWWYENPKETGKPWPKHTVTPVTNNESPQYIDVDGDGKKDLICAVNPDKKNSDGPEKQLAFVSHPGDASKEWTIHAVSEKNIPGGNKYTHGLGVGDMNKDGRNDLLNPQGWWEAPADKSSTPWKFHPADFGQGAQFQIYDYDGDGDNDVLTTSPHAYGIWWHEQLPDGKFAKHEIDKSFSQTHATVQVDLNGDNLPDLITGKRWWAHAKGDPGGDEPAVFFWYELQRKNGRPEWVPHQFDHNSGVGTQFEVIDVNGDKLLDIVTSSKKGVHYFEQTK
jgi:FG-GAP-like repeat